MKTHPRLLAGRYYYWAYYRWRAILADGDINLADGYIKFCFLLAFGR